MNIKEALKLKEGDTVEITSNDPEITYECSHLKGSISTVLFIDQATVYIKGKTFNSVNVYISQHNKSDQVISNRGVKLHSTKRV